MKSSGRGSSRPRSFTRRSNLLRNFPSAGPIGRRLARTGWKRRGSIGLVTTLFPRIDLDPRRTIALMCGPEVMMRFVQREFEKRGVSDDRVYLSLERNMQCAVGFCGHCQFGPEFICLDGPVFRYDRIKRSFNTREA